MFDLNGKTALVTGGGAGIGKAIAHALSDAGAEIILVARRKELLEEALGSRKGAAIALDLLDEGAVADLAGQCRTLSKQPDILVNAAGVNLRQHADEVTEDGWQRTIQLNLTVPFFIAQKIVPHMKKKGWGRIINFASLQSERAFENGIAYGASKGGIVQLTRAMAEAWSKYGINANAIAPGFFPTELTATVFNDPDRAESNARQTAIGRNGTMEDLAGPALFFASDASRYVTGQVLYVDGGYTAK